MTTTSVPPGSQKVVNRCSECNKRIGLTGFKCRCEQLFCSSHRLPEDHCCTFDFKSAGKEKLTKDNPLVQPAKLVKV